jgi:hypothetical protein
MLGASGHYVSGLDVSLGYGAWQAVVFDCFARFLKPTECGEAVAPISLDPAVFYSVAPEWHGDIDVIVANHMLNEMSRHSLVMFLESLDRLRLAPLIVCDGWGFGSRTDGAKNFQTESILNWFGYQIACHIPGFGNTEGCIGMNSDVETPAPVTVFARVSEKNLENCFDTEGNPISQRTFRDLSSRIVTDNRIFHSLLVKPVKNAASELRSMFEKNVLRDQNLKPILRSELVYLDYIGLNSNTKRPYVRGKNALHF